MDKQLILTKIKGNQLEGTGYQSRIKDFSGMTQRFGYRFKSHSQPLGAEPELGVMFLNILLNMVRNFIFLL